MSAPTIPGCTVVDHPMVKCRVAVLRDRSTPKDLFRRTLTGLAGLVAYEATRGLDLADTTIETPLSSCPGHSLRREIIVAPILRAGLGMAEALLSVLPEASVGHVGMYRDEKTFEPQSYYFRTPPGLAEADVFVVDPMVATGQSAADAVTALKAHGAIRLRLVALIGSVPGVNHFLSQHPDVPVFLAALDPGLNERAYIVPGLGDAGDRYFGT